MSSQTPQQWVVRNHNDFGGPQDEGLVIPQLGKYEVLLQIHAVSLNFRDIMVAKGTYTWPTNKDLVPCSDAAGQIIDIGPKVTRFKHGSRVITNFFQNFIAGDLALDESTKDLGASTDGVLRHYAVFNKQNITMRVMPGDTVLTQGTGGVSHYAIQFAILAGAQVVATTSSDEKAGRLRQLGVHKIINYAKDAEWGDTAKGLSFQKRGVDHVIEIGESTTMTQSLKAVALGAQSAIVGTRAGQDAATSPSFHSARCSVRCISIGSRLQLDQMCRAIEVNGLRPIVDPKKFSFEQAKEAFQYLADGENYGKVVVRVVPEPD